jgi:Lrp/AsnC family transcriptional regulator for asnA, asnC and gidA
MQRKRCSKKKIVRISLQKLLKSAFSVAVLKFWCETALMAESTSKRAPGLDGPAKDIIRLLQRDGRMSYAEIGKQVGLSEAAIRQRVSKLTDAGIMQIVAVTDPSQIGFHRQAMIGIRVQGDARRVANALASIEQVDYLVITTGRFDILAEIVCLDDHELQEVLHGSIRCVEGVIDTETFTYLSLEKEHYDWGAR